MTRVLGAISEPYLPLLALWLDQSSPYFEQLPRIIAMDDPAFAALQNESRIEVERAQTPELRGDRQSFWGHRLQEILKRAPDHRAIVQSDADAFWLASPQADFASIDADLIFSADHATPQSAVERWGFSLCCGYYVVRFRAGMAELFSGWLERTGDYRDDQVAFNRLVLASGLEWRAQIIDGLELLVGDMRFGGQSWRLAVLPQHPYTRQPPYAAPNATIAHPFFERQFFQSYLTLYRQLLTEYGSLDRWQARPELMGWKDAPIRDRATWQLLCHAIDRNEPRSEWLAHRGALALRYLDSSSARGDLEAAYTAHDRTPATLLSLMDLYLRDGERTLAQTVLDQLTGIELETPVWRAAMELLFKHRLPLWALKLASAQRARFGTKLIWQNSIAWLRKHQGN